MHHHYLFTTASLLTERPLFPLHRPIPLYYILAKYALQNDSMLNNTRLIDFSRTSRAGLSRQLNGKPFRVKARDEKVAMASVRRLHKSFTNLFSVPALSTQLLQVFRTLFLTHPAHLVNSSLSGGTSKLIFINQLLIPPSAILHAPPIHLCDQWLINNFTYLLIYMAYTCSVLK